MSKKYRRPIKVYCPETSEWVDEQTVTVIDIFEDASGRDNLVFECPNCHKEHVSLRIGG